MENVIVIAVLVIIIGLAVWYIIKAKKKGVKCIGCPDGCSCGNGNGGCSGCAGGEGCGCHTEDK